MSIFSHILRTLTTTTKGWWHMSIVTSKPNQRLRFPRTENPTVDHISLQHSLSLSSHLCTMSHFGRDPPLYMAKTHPFTFLSLSSLFISNPKIPHLCLNQKVIGHKRRTLLLITHSLCIFLLCFIHFLIPSSFSMVILNNVSPLLLFLLGFNWFPLLGHKGHRFT
jgi:hypothetical protein